jgi:DNA-directed RNA polymerase subunit E'/Rpb7
MSNLYIDTKLNSRIVLHPSKMNNDIYTNLKEELVNKVEGKCVKNYGYIVTVYKIDEYSNGVISPNNFLGSAIFNVTYSCRICKPSINNVIIAKVDKINQHLIRVVNGPLISLITMDRLNNEKFFLDQKDNVRYKSGNDNILLKDNDFVKVLILTIRFNDKDIKIKSIGLLQDIATEKEKKQFYSEQYSSNETELVKEL